MAQNIYNPLNSTDLSGYILDHSAASTSMLSICKSLYQLVAEEAGQVRGMGADLELESESSALGRTARSHCQRINYHPVNPENAVKKAGYILLNNGKRKS